MSDDLAAAQALAERMLPGMLDVAMRQPLHIVAEAAVRAAIAMVKGCAMASGSGREADALTNGALSFVDAAKEVRGRAN